jgi:hypothetical protein
VIKGFLPRRLGKLNIGAELAAEDGLRQSVCSTRNSHTGHGPRRPKVATEPENGQENSGTTFLSERLTHYSNLRRPTCPTSQN